MEVNQNIIYRPDLSTLYDDEPSLGHVMIKNLMRVGDKTMLIDGVTNEKVSGKQLVEKSIEIAKALTAVGIKPGNVVSIVSENRLEFAYVMFGTIFLNCTLAPLNHTYSERELEHAFNLSKPKIVFVTSSTKHQVLNVVKKLNFIKKIIFLDNDGNPLEISNANLCDFTNSKTLHNISFVPKRVDTSKATSLIMCSSGTTGFPKGVQLSQSNLIVTIRHTLGHLLTKDNVGDDEIVILGLLPLFHAFGAAIMICVMATGLGTIVVLPKFEEDTFLDCMQKFQCNVVFMVPPLMVFLAKNEIVDRYDISGLKFILCGAAPLSKELEESVKNRLKNPRIVIKQGYGMTELTVGVLTQKDIVKPGSVGDVNFGVYAKVVNENNQTLGPFEQGELCFKGTVLMQGYIGDEQATKATIDEDGWLHTGDIGYFDNDLQFFIVDRIKELIKWKGYQVPPAEIEALLLTHPKIKDCGVIGKPDELAGELPLAFVVRSDESLSEKDIIKFVYKTASPAKRLHGGVIFVNEIPKNPSGKILRRELRDILKQRHVMIKNLMRVGDKTMLIDGVTNEKVSGKQLVENSIEIAKALTAVGIKPGNVVSIVSENRLEFAYVMFGTIFLNCTLAPLNHTYSERELEHAFNLSKPKIVFVTSSTKHQVLNVVKKLNFIKKIIFLDNDGNPLEISNANLCDLLNPEILHSVNFQPLLVDKSKTTALIMCSSGTTGLPKGVLISQSNLIVTLRLFKEHFFVKSNVGDNEVVLLGLLPLFHVFAAGAMIATMGSASGRIVIIPKFEEKLFLNCIEKQRCNVVFLVPPLMVFLAKSPLLNNYDLKSLRFIFCGAAPLSKDLENAVRKRLKNSQLLIKQGYGMSETTFGVLMQKNIVKGGSVGDVNPGVYAKVINEKGISLGPLQKGELCFKGSVIMNGYIGNTKATREVIDEDGWLHTGDIGYYDEDLQFFIVDRIKELIKWKGYQVPPAEIEALLLTHPKIKDCGVIGKADELAGELPLAFVVRSDPELTKDEVIEFVKDSLSPAKRLHGGVIFIDEIPKNPSGKILRRKLRDILNQQATKSKL
ncbi:CLUMA_CG014410, isoform A [Clunio marinus]|uniref:Luciferin 4-monooxygenase n=1 Tax=Clunio marinus TaxID=568069 RepID=A0A1J1IQ10_9DIPT|nr:CLUMA_CG014410, isoform A [Clunio marinus]